MANLATRKYSVIERVMHLSETELVELELWLMNDHQGITVDQYDQQLEEANDKIEQGEFYTHQEATDRLSSWKKMNG